MPTLPTNVDSEFNTNKSSLLIEASVFEPGGDKGVDDPTDEEKNYRRRMLNAVENNEIVLIATQWANVGVDAPKISVLVLAGSNQS